MSENVESKPARGPKPPKLDYSTVMRKHKEPKKEKTVTPPPIDDAPVNEFDKMDLKNEESKAPSIYVPSKNAQQSPAYYSKSYDSRASSHSVGQKSSLNEPPASSSPDSKHADTLSQHQDINSMASSAAGCSTRFNKDAPVFTPQSSQSFPVVDASVPVGLIAKPVNPTPILLHARIGGFIFKLTGNNTITAELGQISYEWPRLSEGPPPQVLSALREGEANLFKNVHEGINLMFKEISQPIHDHSSGAFYNRPKQVWNGPHREQNPYRRSSVSSNKPHYQQGQQQVMPQQQFAGNMDSAQVMQHPPQMFPQQMQPFMGQPMFQPRGAPMSFIPPNYPYEMQAPMMPGYGIPQPIYNAPYMQPQQSVGMAHPNPQTHQSNGVGPQLNNGAGQK